jgi:hypothetical protein
VLKQMSRQEVDLWRLRNQVVEQLRGRGLPENELDAAMCYWPGEEELAKVCKLRTLKKLEEIRQRLDFTLAGDELTDQGKEVTGQGVAPLLHLDRTHHINDTGEQIPGRVIRHPTSVQIRKVVLASVCETVAGKPSPVVTFDNRQPTEGVSLRTVRKRSPRRAASQVAITSILTGVSDAIPGLHPELPATPTHTGKVKRD